MLGVCAHPPKPVDKPVDNVQNLWNSTGSVTSFDFLNRNSSAYFREYGLIPGVFHRGIMRIQHLLMPFLAPKN